MTSLDVLNTLGNLDISVTRFLPGRIIGGKMKASQARPFSIAASVQPVKGREQEFLPEGLRQRYVVKLYCKEMLLTSDDKKAQRADLLAINGEDFEVMVVERNRGLGMDHFKVFAARRND